MRLSAKVARPSDSQGVSLIEMLLVIGLIGLTSALAVGFLGSGFDGIRLRRAGKELTTQLRYTRTLAIATGQPQLFTIDPQQRQWRAPNGHHGGFSQSIHVRFTGARQVQVEQHHGAIRFFPDGASSGGRIELSLKQGGWRIDVLWMTGEVRSLPMDVVNP